MEFLLRRESDLSSPNGRRAAADRILEVLKAHPDRVWRYGAVERLAERLGLPPSLLWDKLGDRKSSVSLVAQATSSPASGQVLTGERRLLGLMLESIETRRKASQLLEDKDLSIEEHREIFRVLVADEIIDQPLDFRDLVTHLKDDAAVAALSAIALGDGPEHQPGEFDGHVTLLQKRSLERLGESLQGEIHRLESTGEDPGRLDALLRAKLELKRRTGQLGRGEPPGKS